MNKKQEEYKNEGLENAVKSKVKPDQVQAIKQFEEEKKQRVWRKGTKPKQEETKQQNAESAQSAVMEKQDEPKAPKRPWGRPPKASLGISSKARDI